VVLDAVHEAALERGAGIIFLGDFWHVRGDLKVELLNRILKCLRKWSQPVIMIPGNHDQVSFFHYFCWILLLLLLFFKIKFMLFLE
jgi:DNA repair exonuclease SbcCD nuclease subunit